MEIDTVIKCLKSDLRRKILKLLTKEDMSAPQLFDELKMGAPKYRQTVNKALETLKECDLIVKYYDNERGGIYYHIISKTVIVKIDQLLVELLKSDQTTKEGSIKKSKS